MKLANLLHSFLILGVGAPLNTLAQGAEVDGAALSSGGVMGTITQAIQALIQATARQFSTSAGTTITLTNLQNLIQRLTAGQAVTVTLDSAYNIVNAITNPFVGQQFEFIIATNASTTVDTPTLLATDVTLSGTTTVLAAAARWYQLVIKQLTSIVGSPVTAGTTFTSITRISTTNLYTIALGTNALTPIVGNLIQLNVTAGTLPSGWYPVVKVTSATSFVIAAPTSSAAWTMTAGTLPGNIVAPATYAPLVTITGEMATVVSTMSV